MAFSKAMPEAFRITLFNGSRDNDGSKVPRVFIGRVSIARTITCKTTCVVFFSRYCPVLKRTFAD